MSDSPTVENVTENDDLDTFSETFFGTNPVETVEEPKNEDAAPADDLPTVEDETEEAEEAPEDESDPDDPDAAEEPEEEPEEAPKKNRKPAKERIDELLNDRYLERQARVQAERRAEELERKLAEAVKPVVAQTPEDLPPDPDAVTEDGKLVYPLGEYDPNYIKDLTRHITAKEMAKLREEAAAEQREKALRDEAAALQRDWDGKLDAAVEEIPDLRETVASLEGELRDIDPNQSMFLAETVMNMPLGPQVLYYLAKNAGEARRIASLPLAKAAVELGRVEARVEIALKKPDRAPVRTPKAPDPAPVVNRGGGGGSRIRPDTENLDDFEKLFFSGK